MVKVFKAFVRGLLAVILLLVLIPLVSCVPNDAVKKASPGEEAFLRHCHVCHVNGGNVIDPAKPLHKQDLAKNGILTTSDIVAKIRHSGPAMPKFDETIIPDQMAREIAEYVLNTFQ